MILAIVIISVLLGVAVVSVGLVVRSLRRLHAEQKELVDASMNAAGASAAGMIFYGSTFSH
jgi:hypothetical protein